MAELTPKREDYSDSNANLFRDQNNLYKPDFWNKPFPDDLLTENDNIAFFSKTFNKTHTALYNRRCKLRVEIETSGGQIEEIDIGTFLLGSVSTDENYTSLKLEDLSKPLTIEPASSVRSGFQWYRNIPLKNLVEELVKKVYYDPRNGELPRDYIIKGLRPKNISDDAVLSSLGKPPSFTRFSSNFGNLKCRAICKANLNSTGEKLYLGLDNELWSYDDFNSDYVKIGEILSEGALSVNIKHLWYNSADGFLWGIAQEEEALVYTNGNSNECQVGVDFIIFRADSVGVEIMFDSQDAQDAQTLAYKLVPGEYHIIPPYFNGIKHSLDDFKSVNSDANPMIISQTCSVYYSILAGAGNFQGLTDIKIKSGSNYYYFPQSENICIPFIQQVGFIYNRLFENYNPAWFSLNVLPSAFDQMFGSNSHFLETDIETNRIYGLIFDNQRSRIIVQPQSGIITTSGKYTFSIDDPTHGIYLLNTESRTSITFNNAESYYDGILPSIEYLNSKYFSIFPTPDIATKTFYPGFFSWYDESICLENVDSKAYFPWAPVPVMIAGAWGYRRVPWSNNFSWKKVAWPWIKYTSGQKGSVTFLPGVGTSGSIFFSVLNKSYNTQNILTDLGRKNFQQQDITTGTDSENAVPKTLAFKYYLYDLATGTFKELTLPSMTTQYNSVDVPVQITATAQNGVNLFLAGIAFNNITDNSSGIAIDTTQFNKTYIYKIDLTDTDSPVETKIYDSQLAGGDIGRTIIQAISRTITEMIYQDDTLIIGNYIRSLVASVPEGEDTPTLGAPFQISYLTNFSSNNDALPEFTNLKDLKWQPRGLASSIIDPNKFYFVSCQNRTQKLNSLELCVYNTSTNVKTSLGFINDIVAGDTNILSNLCLISLASGEESVFGTTDGYYQNPIHKVFPKNHLFKYDKYLGGIIELADMTDLNIWDALVQLAYAFNYIMGFDNDKFFFVPKVLETTPSLFINLDLDDICKFKKTLETGVKNIINAIPYIIKKGEIEWSITLTPNESTTEIDEGRTNLDAALRVRQEDDLSKNIFLKVFSSGNLPNDPNTFNILDEDNTFEGHITNLRFVYLVYNNIIETKLFRDLGSNETEVYLPSVFGSNIYEQINPGDLFVIDYLNEETQETTRLVRVIMGLDFDSNKLTLDSALGVEFPAYTPVFVHRAHSIYNENSSEPELRNNYWSDAGVTFLYDGVVEEIDDDTVALKVMSLSGVGINNIVRFAEDPEEYLVSNKIMIDNNDGTYTNKIFIQSFNGSILPSTGLHSDWVNAPVRGFFVPKAPSTSDNNLIEIGGSNIFMGFESGSTGSFWKNSEGEDSIEIKCAGLILESDSNSKVTAIDLNSIQLYGKLEDSIDSNRFIQKSLLEFITHTTLKESAQPRIVGEIRNLVQSINKTGSSYHIPLKRLLNTSDKSLTKVRIQSKKHFPTFENHSVDFYIGEQSFSLNDFSQTLRLKSEDPY